MYSNYFLMSNEDVKKYVQAKIEGFSGEVQCQEIGDGNLNYVFRVTNASGASIIVKQAGPQARISESFVLSTDRNRIETEALLLEAEYTPDLVPKIILFDQAMSCCVMEDLRDFEIMRKDLMTFKTFDHFADNISTFMAENLIRTTDFLMNPIKKKQLQKQFINPELCEITEHLVYTEPYIDFKKQNILTKGNEEFIHNFVYNDKELHIKVAKLKQQFLTQGQTLLHGDLHTGSIFINEKTLKVIDPEFAFYGPIGYDVGNLVANLTFSWLRALAFNESAYVHWVEEALVDTMEKFEFKARAILKESSEQFTVYEEVAEEFLASVLRDTFAIAGLEINRRIIGLAKVADMTTINHNGARILAERRGLSIAKECIKNEAITSISRYMQLLLKYKGEVLV
ncbi:S-methyl-5-thioribose kinase [Metasolibacillus meyeri]|uniref:S-methyl-5-thioribose kinase n=1 Tax=Metasolibacillus meyeri TaxID=1071052 RepID=A0AAW9NYN8_9BACL|nr:S-methyl-5-thioribose kinase [Metasolibacillus meyeri]MEC1180618.1 S-methyl-5-thioribose kinase [Metasolibacillus meyeri]